MRRGRGDPCERLFLQPEIRVQVDLGGLDGFVPKPQGDDGLVDAMVEQLHRRAVPEDMRTDPFLTQRGTRLCRRVRMLLDETLQGIPTQFGASGRGKERIIFAAGPFLEPHGEYLEAGGAQGSATLFGSLALAA